MLIDIRPDLLKIIQDILVEHVPECDVFVFGSRAKWTAQDTSDLDLCVKGSEALSLKTLAALRDAFSLSRIPYKVDVVDWHRISDSFRQAIQEDLLPLPVPPLNIQKSIVSILSVLDDKIELNRRMNETLEAMARALFKDWFIDFGPVKAKAAGLQPPGLDSDIAALFPDALDETGIPVGWQLSTFSDLVELISGGTPKTSVGEYWNGDIPWSSKSIETIKPPIEIIATFEIIHKPLMEYILKNQEQSKNLAKIRDTILPKLISGEVRVHDIAGEVA